MNLSGLLELLRARPTYQALLARTTGGQSLGLIKAARPFAVAALARDIEQPVFVVTPRIDRAQNMAEQLLAWAPDLRVLTYADPGPLFYQRTPWGVNAIRQRLQVMATLAGETARGTVVVVSARGLMQRTLPRDVFGQHCMLLDSQKSIPGGSPDELTRRWLAVGYEPVTVVTSPGTFSRRGGILDIYPVAAERPVRIELWGDVVESLREFDPATQRSLEQRASVAVTPAREALPGDGPRVAALLGEWFKTQTVPEETGGTATALRDGEQLAQGQGFPLIEFYLPWMQTDTANVLDYLPENSLVVVDDWDDLADTVSELETQAVELSAAEKNLGEIPPDMPLPLVTWPQLADELARRGAVELAGGVEQPAAFEGLFGVGPRFGGQLRNALDHIREILKGDPQRVVLISRQSARLAELWNERTLGKRARPVEEIIEMPAAGTLTMVQGALSEGWIMHDEAVTTLVLTDAEIFGWQRPEPRRRRERRAIAPEDFFADLQPGAVVVHTEYGIGRFQGLEKRTLSGAEREFLLVIYAGGDTLFVPIYQADRLTRYIGPDDGEPDLSRLGTAEWSRITESTREGVEQVARELLELYAARETISGHAFSADTAWQHELEASFPYVETDDQLHALADVKADMERTRPMDRLICGDVGYGKTEVALRAAFKAVMDGKQVAILVPTTVLAQQHFDTFSRRLAPFPVKVDMLSRFRTQAEQTAIVSALTLGQVDILIATHRLLGSDVEFKDLGLLIIDEEQRFGVTHKERLKRMRTEVDVLTLTATPIPRTLYMGLTGVRDISTIDTAPEERLPVVTYVGKREDELIRQAILREIDRGGQVYYVHNRVQSIYDEAERLVQLVPEVTVAVAHGQMSETTLEAVMSQFASGDISVLVSTSIIEAGLDIPNANTLIVDRADLFGLSQLHQLRGRVGRSANRAFAYFFHPPLQSLTVEAIARLETIAEQVELGAGINIAMRDLEIRGAGDILGTRQHGQIAAVGFHLYTRMLSQAVARLKSEYEHEPQPSGAGSSAPATPIRETVTIDLPIPTYVPTDYLPDTALRIQLYRRMADLDSEEAINALGAELADRFGPMPEPVENLLFQLRVKRHALRARVDAIVSESNQLSLRMSGLAYVDRVGLQARLGHNVRVSRSAIWLPRDANGSGGQDWKSALLEVLSDLENLTAQNLPEPK